MIRLAAIRLALPLVLLITAVPLAATENQTADDIMARVNAIAHYAGDNGRAEVEMTIRAGDGLVRKRLFNMIRRDIEDGGAQLFYLYFRQPAALRGMSFLVHRYPESDDDRWLYVPALDLVKRITASDKRTGFAGSHFFYEDLIGRPPGDDHHELLETTDQYYVIRNTPKDPAAVEFSSYTSWIDRKTFLSMKSEYLDGQGRKYRIIEALQVEPVMGCPFVTRSRAQDLLSGGETVFELRGIQCNLGMDDDLFTERYLRRTPREVR